MEVKEPRTLKGSSGLRNYRTGKNIKGSSGLRNCRTGKKLLKAVLVYITTGLEKNIATRREQLITQETKTKKKQDFFHL